MDYHYEYQAYSVRNYKDFNVKLNSDQSAFIRFEFTLKEEKNLFDFIKSGAKKHIIRSARFSAISSIVSTRSLCTRRWALGVTTTRRW